ncbi:MAG: single-stranded DNA-binding protein [Actinomycetia bacterium]|nr:single-stranded DNA-binding protein [Actinomycetes bacterium]
MYVNSVVLVGNLTKDPEAGKPDNGVVANFRVAVDNQRKDDDGNVVSGRVDFVDAEVWGAQAQHCLDSLKKGSRVIVVGPLLLDQWTDGEGNARSKHKVKVRVIGRSLEFA